MITPEALDAPITYEGLKPFGSDMGSGSVVILDETVDIVWAARKMAKFFEHESCGKCTPCREGTFWMYNLLERIDEGKGSEADIKTLVSVANQIKGRTLCALGEFAVNPIAGTFLHFANEYQAKVTESTES